MPEITDFEPHEIITVNTAGNLYVGKKNAGKVAYVYFLRDQADELTEE